MTLDELARGVPAERHLPILGTRNLRDVGGYPAGAGRRTRWRTLFRGDCLDQLPAAAQRALIDHGLRTVIDLRSSAEAADHPNVFESSRQVRYRHLPMREEDIAAGAETLAEIYRILLDHRAAEVGASVRALLEPGALPAIVHCAAGKDRTGIVIALVLESVGVAPETIAEDYGLSNHCYSFRWIESDGPGATVVAVIDEEAPLVDCPPETMLETLDHLSSAYGGARGYLERAGLTAWDLDRLTELLTEPD